MLSFIKIKRKKEKKPKDILKSGALKEIRKLKPKKFSPQIIENFNKIFRIYIREKYKIKTSLTYEEMIENIKIKKIPKEIKQKIMFLSAEINSIEYNSAKFDKKKFNFLIEKFIEILKF